MNSKEIIGLIDLTNLDSNVPPFEKGGAGGMLEFTQKAITPHGHVAAICIYSCFVKEAASLLKASSIKLVTVANFPEGNHSLVDVLNEIKQSISDGAEEIDVVFPYQAYLNGDREQAIAFVVRCKQQCGDVTLKVILETGALQDASLIANAAHDVIVAGADFVKTSTGKIPQGATLAAATAILKAIKNSHRPVGLKVAGGIREPQQAMQYIELAKSIMGETWPTPQTFRIGASSLLDKLI